MKKFIVILILVVLVAVNPVFAQFGKNRVNWSHFKWQIYETPNTVIYFYPEERNILPKLARAAEEAYKKNKEFLKWDVVELKKGKRKRVKPIIFFYRNHVDFEQENVSPQIIEEEMGAFAESVRWRICIPADYPEEQLIGLLTHEMSHIFQYSIWYKSRKPDRGFVTPFSKNREAVWLFEGLSERTRNVEDISDNLLLRYYVKTDSIPPIELWDRWNKQYLARYVIAERLYQYMIEKYGKEKVIKIIKEFRRKRMSPSTEGLERAIRIILKIDFPTLNAGFRRWMKEKYFYPFVHKKELNEYGGNLLRQNWIRVDRKKPFFAFEIAPKAINGKIVALTYKNDGLRIVLIDAETGEIIKTLTKGMSLYKYGQYFHLETFNPGNTLAYNDNGRKVLIFSRMGEKRGIVLINTDNGKVKKVKLNLDNTTSPDIKDGKVVFSAQKNNQSDIFLMDLKNGRIENITNDKMWDYAPSFSPDGRKIMYISYRNKHYKIFELNLRTKQKKQLTFGNSDEYKPQYDLLDNNKVWFISDKGKGKVLNLYQYDRSKNEFYQMTDVCDGVLGFALERYSFIPLKELEKLIVSVIFPIEFYPLHPIGLYPPHTENAENLYVLSLGYSDPLREFSWSVFKADPRKFENKVVKFGKIKAKKKINKKKNDEIKEKDIKKYKTKFYIDNMFLQLYVMTVEKWFGIMGYGNVSLSDVPGDKRIMFNMLNYFWYKHNHLDFFEISHRINYGIDFHIDKNYMWPAWQSFASPLYGYPAMDPVFYYIEEEKKGLSLFGQYPLDMFNRIEVSLQYDNIFYTHPNWEDMESFSAEEKEMNELRAEMISSHMRKGNLFSISLSLVRDTSRYKEFGPFTGGKYRVDMEYGNKKRVITGTIRKYFPIGEKTVLALRGYAGAQSGTSLSPFFLGDMGELRGFKWYEFSGDRIMFVNMELRIPLVNNFNLLGIPLGNVRGNLFVDVGRSWWGEDKFNKLNQQLTINDIALPKIKGSMGLDISIPFRYIIGTQLHIVAFKRVTEWRIPLPKFEPKWHITAWAGWSF